MIFYGLICMLIGFVGGFLVFRNNQDKINAIEAEAEKQADELIAKLEKFVEDGEDMTDEVKEAVKTAVDEVKKKAE
jgi:hypothetical protein